MHLKRVSKDPILVPRKHIAWEKDAVFNCAAVHEAGSFHLHYRAVHHRTRTRNHSCIGYARSADGVHFEQFEEHVLAPSSEEERQGVEDPRITKIGDTYHMLYVGWDGVNRIEVKLATSKDLVHWERKGSIKGLEEFGWNKDAALFPEKINGRYALLHRPHPNIWLSFSDDLIHWTDHKCIMKVRANSWEDAKIGAGAQPIKTPQGWLIVYHGVRKEATPVYRLGAALLDLKDPSIVLKRQAEPILEPELEWELKGDVPNVVFTCGAVLTGPELWVYYGGADTVIGLAKGDVEKFLKG